MWDNPDKLFFSSDRTRKLMHVSVALGLLLLSSLFFPGLENCCNTVPRSPVPPFPVSQRLKIRVGGEIYLLDTNWEGDSVYEYRILKLDDFEDGAVSYYGAAAAIYCAGLPLLRSQISMSTYTRKC